jgi:hypothetical protein
MNRFYNALSLISVILAPVAMMAIAGWEAYSHVLAVTHIPWLALVSGVAAAGLLESIGIVAGETTLLFHARRDPRWRMAAAVLLLYVVAGLALLWRSPLVLLPLLAGAVYLLVGLRAQAHRELTVNEQLAAELRQDKRAAEADDREWRREQWRIKQADATRLRELELAQSQHRAAEAGSQAGSPTTEPAQSHVECEDCGRTFPSVQAINAHRRFCRGLVSQNGHGE